MSTVRQHSKQYKFDVVYFLPWKNQLEPDLRALGCKVTCLSSNNVFQIVLKIPGLLKLIREGRYDFVHAHLPWTGIISRVVCKILDVPLVYTEHNIVSKYKMPTRIFHKLTYNWQDYVVAVSDEVERAIRKELNPSIPIRTIVNGVDTVALDRTTYNVVELRKQFGLDRDAIIVGTVAVFRPQKRLDRWIRIARTVSNKFDNVRFVMVGDGLLRTELERQAYPPAPAGGAPPSGAGGSGLGGSIIFAGLTSEPDKWMACMDIFLMSSDFEGLPVALLEAMSLECVPVVTLAGGIPSVVSNEENGFLYQPEDEAHAEQIIGKLIQEKETVQHMGKNARSKIVSSFGIEKMVNALEEVYDHVIS